ncbi:PIN domain-containing protein [Pararhizobium sp. PWRC1-1]|uniref:PIN domain-containing protein n=1 Tax=Pararhizobium sp. PWRC1-1 TaxID=2804566 RepID=UPI003CF2E5C6
MIVVDANVMLSAFRSANGASHLLVRKMISGDVSFSVSPAVALEYEDVLKRPGILGEKAWLSHSEIDAVLDAVFARAKLVSPWFRFRPFLNDPKDDLYRMRSCRQRRYHCQQRQAFSASGGRSIRFESYQSR